MKSHILTLLTALLLVLAAHASPQKPNIVFILADDLGYADLGCYGQQKIRTPNLDRMAAGGMRFTDFHAGGAVCIPSRSCLMTGLHEGHTRHHGSNNHIPLEAEDVTVAEVLHDAGYAAACLGKWAFSDDHDGPGAPQKQGWDYYYGEPNQTTVHSYYLPRVWEFDRDGSVTGQKPDTRLREIPVPENANGGRKVYSHDLLAAKTLAYLDAAARKAKPFFLYLAFTIPHATLEPPDVQPYASEDWPEPEKKYAAMVTRLDTTVGQIFERLKKLGLDEQTIVFFASDNGPTGGDGHRPEFFHSAGPLKGIKAMLTEGGLRVPMIVRWPGRIQSGAANDEPLAFCDFLPTAAALAGTRAPARLDGLSFLPALLGQPQPHHEFLYWEAGTTRAVRLGYWKAIWSSKGDTTELYNLQDDLAESRNLADQNLDVVKRAKEIMQQAHTVFPGETTAKEKPKKEKKSKN